VPLALGELATIFATIHLGLMSRRNPYAIGVALMDQRQERHVRVGYLTIATQIDAPELWANNILGHRTLTRTAY
jgi:hypothetical protein